MIFIPVNLPLPNNFSRQDKCPPDHPRVPHGPTASELICPNRLTAMLTIYLPRCTILRRVYVAPKESCLPLTTILIAPDFEGSYEVRENLEL